MLPVVPSGDGRRLGEDVDADDLLLARLDAPGALRHRAHQAALQLVDGLERAAERQHVVELRPRRRRRSSSVRASMTREPSKMSSYSSRSVSKASTCCIRNDHCWSHGRGRPSASFHAGSWIDRARARFDSVTRQHLEHDALHVVLGLRLGEAERVDLHAVAEPAGLLVGDAVALEHRCGPTAR